MPSPSKGFKIARERIAEEKRNQTGFLDLGELGLHELPEEIWELEHLEALNLGAWWRDGEKGLSFAKGTGVANNFSRPVSITSVFFPRLHRLFLPCIEGTDFIREFFLYTPSLVSLDCTSTEIESLEPFRGLAGLQSLSCSKTLIKSLEPLRDLIGLQSLSCWSTEVYSLEPLKSLTGLQSLSCGNTRIDSLEPLKNLKALRFLDCSHTRINSLEPLKNLKDLQALTCIETQIDSLEPLTQLTALTGIFCSNSDLTYLPERLIWKKTLEKLDLRNNSIEGIPPEVISAENCLPALRAHFKDLEKGDELVTDVKILLLGNGLIGKTQFCAAVQGEPYDDESPSTHGVVVSHQELDGNLLHWWDFGGQEIYHGTHALFMKTRAVFVTLWTPESENQEIHHTHGMTFRNHHLDYWVEMVHQLGGAESPLLVVQCRCDRPEDEELEFPTNLRALKERFGYHKLLYQSSSQCRGLASVREALADAVQWMRRKQGEVRIGRGRMRVKQRLEEMLAADAALPEDVPRQHRLLSLEQFEAICREEGGVSSPEHFRSYLDDCGVVFHRPGLFDDQIVLDQQWALNAIYTVFNREKCLARLRGLKGRFTRILLESLVWRNHTEDQQQLFLSMMESCGLCFRLRDLDNGDYEYIAPALLTGIGDEDVKRSLAARWDHGSEPEKSHTYKFSYEFPGLITAVISAMGTLAGIDALYWQDGFCGYEEITRSHILIRRDKPSAGHKRLHLHLAAKGSGASALLALVGATVEAIFDKRGCAQWNSMRDAGGSPRMREDRLLQPQPEHDTTDASKPPVFGTEPRSKITYAVSYAWREDNETVDKFCRRAEECNIELMRDTTHAGIGEDLARFMKGLAAQDRVIIVLSENYLKSPWCMTELLEIWRGVQGKGEDFREKVSCYVLPGIDLSDLAQKARAAAHWMEKFSEVEAIAKQYGPSVLGEAGFREYNKIQQFYLHVGNILDVIAYTLHPKGIDQLAHHVFDR